MRLRVRVSVIDTVTVRARIIFMGLFLWVEIRSG